MADKKISELTALSGADTASNDALAIVDTSAVETKKITVDELQKAPVSSGTANGVAYLNGSKVLTTGSALTFDGTNLGVGLGGVAPSAAIHARVNQTAPTYVMADNNGPISANTSAGFACAEAGVVNAFFRSMRDGTGNVLLYNLSNAGLLFGVNNSEQMRLTFTGLGIGTSSPAYKLTVAGGDIALDNARAINFKTSSGGYGNVLSVDSSNRVNFGDLVTSASAMVLSAGNLGLGVTPSGWNLSGLTAFQVRGGSLASYGTGNDTTLGSNKYYNLGDKYIANDYATQYAQKAGQHLWFIAPSGTAGNAISFTQAMTLDASGNLVVGGTSPQWASSGRGLVEVNGASAAMLGFDVGGVGKAYLFHNGTDYYLNNVANGASIFSTNNIERARIDANGNFIHQVNSTAPTLSTNSTMSFELTSDTSLKVVVRGTDGVTRSATLTLA